MQGEFQSTRFNKKIISRVSDIEWRQASWRCETRDMKPALHQVALFTWGMQRLAIVRPASKSFLNLVAV